MVRITKSMANKMVDKATKAARREARRIAYEELQKEGYLSRMELAKKYNINPQKVWRLIKESGLPYDKEIEKIKESEFLEWKKKNEHLLKDRRVKS